MTTSRSRVEVARRLLRLIAVAAALAAVQGCAVYHGAAELARKALDPGVPGKKPLTAEEAAQLSDREILDRLTFVTRSLDDNELHASLWYYGFLAVNAAGMAAGAATAAVESNDDKQVYDILNSSLGLIGTTYLLLDPLPGRSGSDPLAAMPSATHEDRAAQLAAGEEILYRAAGRAEQRTGWLLHTGNVVLNASAASVLVARDDLGDAALLFFLNTAVGEAQILLTPWEPLNSWQAYREQVDSGGIRPDPQVRWGIGPLPTGQGLALQARF
ncbi:hypothetical protein KF840_09630 [bacterium]|nr:hypothetical protein [bacterium]